MVDFTGSKHRDIFTGTDGADLAYGFGGRDRLIGAGGADLLSGGSGGDYLDGGDDDDYLASYTFDGNFDPVATDIYAERDVLMGGGGDDVISAGFGDVIDGGDGYNKLAISFMGATAGVTADFTALYDGGHITIGGGRISGIIQTTYIQGSDFDDTIVSIGSYYGFSQLFGMGGDDRIVADYYSDSISGGDGNDDLDSTGSQYTSVVHGDAGDDVIRSNLGENFTTCYGDAGDDTIFSNYTTYGGDGDDVIRASFSYYGPAMYGGAGNDRIYGADDSSSLFGGAGADRINGGAGGDVLGSADQDEETGLPSLDLGAERDRLFGGSGDDRLYAGFGDIVGGGDGTDTLWLSLAGARRGVTLDTAALIGAGPHALGGGSIADIERLAYVLGSAHADTIDVATQSTRLTVDGGDGNDVVVSHGSSIDWIGGAGNDRLVDGAAADVQDGGVGVDTLDYRQATRGVTVSLGHGGGDAGSGPGGDVIYRVENLAGSAFDDKLAGSDLDNALNGGEGDDVLAGGAGRDAVTGGAGADRFVFADGDTTSDPRHADSIVDFTRSDGDRIDLHAIDAEIGQGGDQAFAFVGTAAFSEQAGELRYEIETRGTVLSGDTDGDGTADFTILLLGAPTLQADDFVL